MCEAKLKPPSGLLMVAVGFIPQVEKRSGKPVVTSENFKGLAGKGKKGMA